MTLHQVPRRRRPGPGRRFLDTSIGVLARTWWVATAAVLLVGAVVRYDLVAASDLGPLAGTSEVAAGGGGGLAAADSEFYSYPNTRYAGVDLAVLDARIVPRFQTGAPIAIVELGVRNQTGLQARLPTKMIRLVGPNGVNIELDRFEYTRYASRMVVEPGSSGSGLAVFHLATAASENLSDYHIQIAENGRWPASLPLSNDVSLPANSFPRPLQVTTASVLKDETGEDSIGGEGSGTASLPGFEDLTIELAEATDALEYGVYRAPIGEHLAVVTVEITGAVADASAAADCRQWTLVESELGGNRNVLSQSENRAIRVISGATDAPQVAGTALETTITLQLVFSYSTESSKLTLQIGEPGDRQTVADFAVQPVE